MNFTGFDPEAINQLASDVKGYADETAETIINNLKTGVISPISKCWFTPEGVEYWQAFADDVKQTSETIAEAFNSFVDSIGEAEKNWAENTKADVDAVRGDIGNLNMTLDISEIKEKDGTKMGIIESEATSVATSLSSVEETIMSSLKEIASKLNSESAFLGQGQGEAIKSCFGVVEEQVAKIFRFLTEGDNNVMNQIKSAVSKYGDVGSSTSSAFNNVK